MEKEDKFKKKADELIQFCKSRVTALEKQIGLNIETEKENENIKNKFIEDFLADNFILSVKEKTDEK